MIAQREVKGLKIQCQLPRFVQPPQIVAGFMTVGRDETGIVIIKQVRILAYQAESGGRLGTNNFIALPDRVREQADILGGDGASPLDITH